MSADPERAWESGWDGHERAQRRRLAALPLAEKLTWLEESHAMLIALARARERQNLAPPTRTKDKPTI